MKFLKSYERRKKLAGLVYVSPFIIGFIFLFLSPLAMYFSMGFSRLEYSGAGVKLTYIGLQNFKEIFLVQEGFLKKLMESLSDIAITLPSILLLSLFLANILNQKFHGRTIARAIFFIPVVIASGVAAVYQKDSLTTASFSALVNTVGTSGDALNISKMLTSMFNISANTGLYGILSDLVNKIYTITVGSGIQILIFLAGLQNISKSLYEASSIEGATSWENFWKITFPMMTPLIMVNAVYTVVDVMGGTSNGLINSLYELSIMQSKYGISSAMGTIYFLTIFLIIGLIMFLLSRIVFYEN